MGSHEEVKFRYKAVIQVVQVMELFSWIVVRMRTNCRRSCESPTMTFLNEVRVPSNPSKEGIRAVHLQQVKGYDDYHYFC